MTPRLWLLAVLWTLWCFSHSLLIARGVQRWLAATLGPRFRYVRLVYNIFAVVSFFTLYAYALTFRGPTIFDWWGAWIPIAVVLVPATVALFWAGARMYDLGSLLGLSQMRGAGIGEAGGLTRQGILGAIRHPWYTGGLLILWVRPKDAASLVTSIVLSVYLVVGAYVEEAKLIAEFGDAYRAYRREVSMFLPFRWVRARLASRG